MSQYPDARFLKSADAEKQFVPDTGREVAFAGRSNAGKSSAINVIVNRRQFARTSKTPGRTQLVNFFELREGQRLVDLPGYGFAKVSDSKRRHWGDLLSRYFEVRTSLSGLILIVDIRRRLTDFDRQMIAFAESGREVNHTPVTSLMALPFDTTIHYIAIHLHPFAESVELPIHILLTKSDKLKKGQAANALLEVRKEVADRASVQLFSALKRQGEQEARDVLEQFLGDNA